MRVQAGWGCVRRDAVDVSTLRRIVATVEARHGKARGVWVFDRGSNSGDNHAWLRRRGACYLVGTPKSQFGIFERHLSEVDWQRAASEVEGKLCPTDPPIPSAEPIRVADLSPQNPANPCYETKRLPERTKLGWSVRLAPAARPP